MWKKTTHLVLVVCTGLLLGGGCSFDGWWPWAVGAGVLGLLGLGT